MEILKPYALNPGDTLGIFTPSSPSYGENEGLFQNGLKHLASLGFKTKLGNLTAARGNQGYRSGSPQERADELMSLVRDPEVKGLVATIGGNNSSSLIPYLDFAEIRRSRKLLCGYSDITSLHLAYLHYAGLSSLYGPTAMTWHGEWPNGIPESSAWFLEAATKHRGGSREVLPPARWSNHRRSWDNGDWQKIPRQWQLNPGWTMLSPGQVEAPILAVNLNTLLTAAGTPYWPHLNGKILLLEDMAAPLSGTERALRQLSLMGTFDQIAGLIIGKPEYYEQEGAPFDYDDIFREVIGPRPYPIVSNFDCSHTVPMISIPQLSPVALSADAANGVSFTFLDGAIA
ncbi:MAG: LD-carboxypeptidase [Proteobacteria bacterium]|nr:MAG: LD-carboxypeptidase [Pseudomonadota bacterium]